MTNDRIAYEEKEAVWILVDYRTQVRKIFKKSIMRADYHCLVIRKKILQKKIALKKIRRVSLRTTLIT